MAAPGPRTDCSGFWHIEVNHTRRIVEGAFQRSDSRTWWDAPVCSPGRDTLATLPPSHWLKLLLKSFSCFRFGFEDRLSGISPLRKLSFRLREERCNEAIVSGSFPVRAFWERSKQMKLLRFPKPWGNSPESWFWKSLICSTFFRPEMLFGILPDREFWDK